MKRIVLFALAGIIVVGFLIFMTTFTVRFTETAVVTTFGRATESSVVVSPGLKLKWPSPIQSATVYDKRARLLEARDETQQTADQRQLVIGAFLTWRIADPLEFYKAHRSDAGASPAEQYREAEKKLGDVFRSALSEVSRFTLDDLFAAGDRESRIPELEAAILGRLARADDDVQGYGIEVLMVGVNSVQLPASATRQIFEQMKSERAKLAADAESRGESLADFIRAQARDDAARIESFVAPAVGEILARGEREAAEWLAIKAEEPKLAEFLERIRLLREGVGGQTTLVLPTTMIGLELFDPESLATYADPAPETSGR